MSYEPLHHKYRPQTFADLVGQEAITITLTNAVTSQRIAPAYLFTGPRGTGKTSSARILAKSLNCLNSNQPTPTPCGQCEVCRAIAQGNALDVIEIDAASNTGVDNIREIIERAQFAPVQCRYKVYVIDECHMLSVAAFNALLKTLEEPPARIVFVLATTDPQRVLPTIISRCQRFDYRRIPLESMVSHLKKIAHQEQIDITLEALTLVAQIANGGLRDAESLLDQLSLLADTITVERIWDLVGAVPEQDLLALLQAIASNQAETVIEHCRHLMNRGREPLIVLQNLASFYLNLLIAKTAPKRPDLVAVTTPTWQALCTEAKHWNLQMILQGQQHLKDSETQLRNTTQPRLWLEITLLGLLPSAYRSEPPIIQPQVTQRTLNEAVPTAIASSPPTPTPPPEPEPSQPVSQSQSSTPELIEELPKIAPVTAESTSQTQIWSEVLALIQPNATQVLLRQHCCLLSLTDFVAHVGVKTQPLLKLAQARLTNIEAAFEAICHRKVKVHLKIATAPESSEISEPHSVKQPEQSIPNPSIEVVPQEQSNPPPATQPTTILNNRDNQDRSQPSNDPKTNFIQLNPFSQTPDLSNDVAVSSSTLSTVLSDNPNSLSSVQSEEEIQKAAESLARCFEGEIVVLTSQVDDEPSAVLPVGSNTTTQISSESKDLLNQEEAFEQEINSNNQPIIRGRPDLIDWADDEDIPF